MCRFHVCFSSACVCKFREVLQLCVEMPCYACFSLRVRIICTPCCASVFVVCADVLLLTLFSMSIVWMHVECGCMLLGCVAYCGTLCVCSCCVRVCHHAVVMESYFLPYAFRLWSLSTVCAVRWFVSDVVSLLALWPGSWRIHLDAQVWPVVWHTASSWWLQLCLVPCGNGDVAVLKGSSM